MKRFVLGMIPIILSILISPALAQSNLLENGGFEAVWQLGHYPRIGENLFDRCPIPWMDFNPNDDERWYTDSIAPINTNLPNPLYQHGYFRGIVDNNGAPWETGNNNVPTTLQAAHSGKCFVGIDLESDWFTREGIQTKPLLSCGLNSGTYTVDLWWARAYERNDVHFAIALSDQSSDRRKIVANETIYEGQAASGVWNNYNTSFTLDYNHPDEMDNTWFSITGNTSISSTYREYTYFDDIRLYRPCDELLQCVPTHGQICPTYAFPHAPGDLMRIGNIANASDMHLKVYASNSQLIKDTVYHNANGLPDFRLTRLGLPISTAAAIYQYDLEITNLCGGVKKTGSIQVLDTASYNPITSYIDATAHWSPAPIPCCLSTLTLQNMLIVGDVSYIVRDEITVQNGVSIAPGSHVILQAGHVTELSNVEFDGSNSTLEIIEVPCPSRMACGNGCAGGAMVIDAGELVMPVQIAADSAPAVKGSAVPTTSVETATPAIETATRLWAYPNPFEKQIQIGIALPETMTCTVLVQDLQMRPIRTVLQQKEMPAGTHEIAVELGGLPAGVYLVQLQAGSRSYHQRVVKQ